MKPEVKNINLGCGFKKLNDHWNVDIEPKCNPDEVVDLEIFPWPYEDDFFEKIVADNILEHLGQDPKIFIKIIKEMYRISKNGAEWYISYPHHRSDLFFDDCTHVRTLTEKTFKLFDQKYNFYTIQNNISDTTLGLYNKVDIEVKDSKYNLVNYWIEKQKTGNIGFVQLNENLNTMANVCESVEIFLCVHKPGRFEDRIPL